MHTTPPSASTAAASYGISEQRVVATDLDRAAEEVTCLGFAAVDSGYPPERVAEIASAFDAVQRRYVESFGEASLREIDEHNGIRLPLAFDERFIELATNPRVLELVERLMRNKFILNQQNGIINPPGETYNQGIWHRDLPYQHFVSSRPLAINALYCVDDFTADNGATFVLPGSHTHEACPSDEFVERNATQVSARAGTFIVINGMTYHRGGANKTLARRRAVNHLYSTAFIKQQIDIPSALGDRPVSSPDVAYLLGYRYRIPKTVSEFLESRRK